MFATLDQACPGLTRTGTVITLKVDKRTTLTPKSKSTNNHCLIKFDKPIQGSYAPPNEANREFRFPLASAGTVQAPKPKDANLKSFFNGGGNEEEGEQPMVFPGEPPVGFAPPPPPPSSASSANERKRSRESIATTADNSEVEVGRHLLAAYPSAAATAAATGPLVVDVTPATEEEEEQPEPNHRKKKKAKKNSSTASVPVNSGTSSISFSSLSNSTSSSSTVAATSKGPSSRKGHIRYSDHAHSFHSSQERESEKENTFLPSASSSSSFTATAPAEVKTVPGQERMEINEVEMNLQTGVAEKEQEEDDDDPAGLIMTTQPLEEEVVVAPVDKVAEDERDEKMDEDSYSSASSDEEEDDEGQQQQPTSKRAQARARKARTAAAAQAALEAEAAAAAEQERKKAAQAAKIAALNSPEKREIERRKELLRAKRAIEEQKRAKAERRRVEAGGAAELVEQERDKVPPSESAGKKENKVKIDFKMGYSPTDVLGYTTFKSIAQIDDQLAPRIPKNSSQTVGLIGIVMDGNESPSETKNGDLCETFRICDPSGGKKHFQADSIGITLFATKPKVGEPLTELPNLKPGNIVLLRNVKLKGNTKSIGGSYNLVGYHKSNGPVEFKWAKWDHKNPSTLVRSPGFDETFTPMMQPLVEALVDWQRESDDLFADDEDHQEVLRLIKEGKASDDEEETSFVKQPVVKTSYKTKNTTARSVELFENLRQDKYYDHVVEVIKVHLREGQPAELYVVDYTQNERFFNFSPETTRGDWKGPCGHRAYHVSLFEEAGDEVRQRADKKWCRAQEKANPGVAFQMLEPGTIIFLRNVRCKLDGNGNWEGTVHGDREKKGIEAIRVLGKAGRSSLNPGHHKVQVDALLARRQRYFDAIAKGEDVNALPEKVARRTDGEQPQGPMMPAYHPNRPSEGAPPAQAQAQAAQTTRAMVFSTDLPKTSVLKVIDDPRTEFLARIVGKVVDYIPRSMTQWVKATCPTCKAVLSPVENNCMEVGHGEAEYYYDFALAVMDSSVKGFNSLPIEVTKDDSHAVLACAPPNNAMRQPGAEAGDAFAPLKRALHGILDGKKEFETVVKMDRTKEKSSRYARFAEGVRF